MLAAAAALALLSILWTKQQEDLLSKSQRLFEAQDPAQRIALADSILKKYPWLPREQRSTILLFKAVAYGQAGQLEDMEAVYREIIASDPQNHEVLNNLAYEWARRGKNLDSAEAYSARAVAIVRDKLPSKRPTGVSSEEWGEIVQSIHGNYLDTYGWTLYQKGRLAQALAALSQAAELVSDPTVGYHYGLSLYKSGQIDSALPRLAMALAAGIEESTAVRSDLERIYLERFNSLKGLDKLVTVARAKLAESQAKAMAAEAGKLVGSAAPDFTLEDMAGVKRSLSEQRGRVVVLDFWAEWCGPCRKSLPLVQKVWGDFRDRGVVVWGVNLDDPNKHEQAKKFVEAQGLDFPMLKGGRMGSGLDQNYQVSGIPTTLVIDKMGVVRFRHIGYRQNLDKLLASNIESLLKEP